MALTKRFLQRFSRTAYVQSALAHPVNPAELRRRPNRREWLGLGLVVFSYLIGWPAVALLTYLAYRLRAPLVVMVGGPVTYGTSHLVFLLGAWLAGASFTRTLLRFATRRAYEKHLPEAIPRITAEASPEAKQEKAPEDEPAS